MQEIKKTIFREFFSLKIVQKSAMIKKTRPYMGRGKGAGPRSQGDKDIIWSKGTGVQGQGHRGEGIEARV